jgi:hypothetical protein
MVFPDYRGKTGQSPPYGYTDMVLRLSGAVFLTVLLLTGCESEQQKKEKIQQAILDRLQSHSGLDLKALEVTTTAVTFEKKKAFATVSFHQKDDPIVNSGMVMKYTLEERDGKWQVTGIGNSQGAGGTALPSGHPPTVGTDLPSGHPSVGPK